MKRLRVYLSSTFEDLKEYRAAVFAALEKAGLDVARMEAYTAADERPLDKCLRDVAQSEIYVGLYAWRYGYEPPVEHGNPEGKSITELEYRQAEAGKLRKLLFFAHPDTKDRWPDHFKDEATGEGERGEKLNAFRKEVGTEKTASFFRTPDELATLVLAAIMHSGLSGRPYNVPPRPAGVVPRPNLTQQLVDSIVSASADTPGINTLVQGAGGFGKTTLAIDACHRAEVVNAFPDGMLWVELGEKSDLAKKLSNLHASATGSPPTVEGIDAIGEALAKALEGRRCLVVVDDVWRLDDLSPFLRLDGPRLLVTTRIRTLMEQAGQTGWLEVPVDEMEVGEAAALLGRGLLLDDPSRDTLRGLADRLGCWPLLLDLANARLREEHKRHGGNLAESIHSLIQIFERAGVLGFDRRDSKARNAAVKKSVEVGLEMAEAMFPGLAEKAAEISIFPENVPIPVRVLADLWKMDEFYVEEEAVRPLDNLSILRWGGQTNDVRLHGIIQRVLSAMLVDPAVANRKLMNTWNDSYHLPHEYAWHWFGWHCVRANEQDRLLRLLLDFGWLNAKLKATDILSVISDYDLVANEPDLKLIQRALRLSIPALSRGWMHLPSQLIGRLRESDEPRIRALLEKACAGPGTAWLCPQTASLTAPGPLLQTFTDHTGRVTALAVLPDGRVVSGSGDKTLRVWDVDSGARRMLEGHTDEVWSLAVLPDGRVVSGSGDKTLRVWDVDSGTSRMLEGHVDIVGALAVLPDGRVVSGSWDCTLRVWDVDSGASRMLEGHTSVVRALEVLPDGRVVSGSGDKTLRVWDVDSGASRMLEGHVDIVWALAVLPDGRVVSGSFDKTLRLWEVTGASRMLDGHTGSVTALAVLPDGRVVSGSQDKTLRVWDVDSGTSRMLEGHTGSVTALAVLPDGRVVSRAGWPEWSWSEDQTWDCTLRVWDVDSGASRMLEGHTGRVTALAVLPDGRVVSGSGDKTLRVWDVDSGARRMLEGHTDEVWSLAVLPDGRVVSGSRDKTLRVWDVDSGTSRMLEGHVEAVWSLAVLPDGRVVSGFGDETLRVWDVDSGTSRMLEGHTGEMWSLAVLPDGRVVSGSQDKTLRVWDVDSGTSRMLEGHTDRVTALAVLPDGRVVSGSKDWVIILWDLETASSMSAFIGDAAITACVAARVNRLVVGSANGAVHILEIVGASMSPSAT